MLQAQQRAKGIRQVTSEHTHREGGKWLPTDGAQLERERGEDAAESVPLSSYEATE
jgi:hypothetical protein